MLHAVDAGAEFGEEVEDKGWLEVALAAGIENDELLPDRERGGLHVSSLPLGLGSVRMHEHGNCCRLGHELAQQFQSLRPQHVGDKDHARDVAARPVEAGNEAVADRIAPAREDDRHCRGRGLGRGHRNGVAGDHSHLPVKQIGHQRRQPLRFSRSLRHIVSSLSCCALAISSCNSVKKAQL